MTEVSPTCYIVGEGALPILCGDILIGNKFAVLGVLSSDFKVKQWALKNNVRFITPSEGLGTIINGGSYDFLFSINNSIILPNDVCASPLKYAINYHDGPLPRYAGMYATSWALINHEKEHGISWHCVSNIIDGGRILKQATVAIDPEETVSSLNAKCFEAALMTFKVLLDELSVNTETPVNQDLSQRTYFPLFKRIAKAGIIDWSIAKNIHATVRSLTFDNYTNNLGLVKIFLNGEFLIVRDSKVFDTDSRESPGTITQFNEEYIRVSCSDGEVGLGQIMTMEGKELSTSELFENYKLSSSYRLEIIDKNIEDEIISFDATVCRHEKYWVDKFIRFNPVGHPYFNFNIAGKKSAGRKKASIPFKNEFIDPENSKNGKQKSTDYILAGIVAYLARINDIDAVDIGFSDKHVLGNSANDLKPLFSEFVPVCIKVSHKQDLNGLVDALRVELGEVGKKRTYIRDIFFRHPELEFFRNQVREKQLFPVNIIVVDNINEVESNSSSLLTFIISESTQEVICQYNTSAYTLESIDILCRQIGSFVEKVIASPELPFASISLLTKADEHQLLFEFNNTGKDYPEDKAIHQLFEEQAARTPDNIALVFEGTQMTYKELNTKSNQLARHIRDQYNRRTGESLKSDTLIALFLERSLETIVGILGVLKAGAAYVPMDPEYPRERIDYMLADTQAELVLTQRRVTESDAVHLPQNKILYIDLTEELYHQEDISNLPIHITAKDLAYVIYTSGTTGKPKGVMIEHNSLINLIYGLQDCYNIESSERFVLFSNYVFDASVEQIFLSLLSGATLFVIDSNTIGDYKGFQYFIEKNQISHLDATPSYLSSLKISSSKALKRIVFGGEYLSKELFDRYCKIVPVVINAYGPTEASVTSLVSVNSYLLSNRRIQNVKLYVLDQNFSPVPIGVIGELYIGGPGVARGYLHNETLTKERFIANPFASESDKQRGYTRLYKTGDLVRCLPDGSLEYLGRNDDQVKIRGYRVELGEIEHTINQISGIKQSCVLVCERETTSGKIKYLVGYYVSDQRSEVVIQSDILTHLSRVLPDYMVPSALVAMESFPLTINGKLDKRALPDPDFVDKESYVAPTTETEKALSKIWAEVLGIERVGVEDNFFRIGGDSILAIRTSHRMSKALGTTIGIADIFKYKTISEILRQRGSFNKVSIAKVKGNSSVLSFAQERLWFIEEYEEGTNAYHIPLIFELAQDTDKEGIKYAIDQIVSRHEILRSTISRGDDQKGVQEVHAEPLKIEEVIIEDKDFEEVIGEDINRPFVLSEEYPIRVKLYTLTSAKQASKEILLINLHHIASDGWSLEIFQKERRAYYEAYVSGNTSFRLPELEIQYKDYAAWQRSYLTGDLLSKQLSYWKQKLSGYENLALPTDYSRPGKVDYKGSGQVFILSKATSEKLRLLAKEKATTLHSVLLSSVSILLGKYSGAEDIITGSPIANRHHWQTEKLIGFFVNSQVNRVVLRQGQSFESLIETTHQDQVLSQSHQDLPFEKLVDELNVERDPSRHPIFQVMFSVQSFDQSARAILEKEEHYLSIYEGSSSYAVEKFDLSIFFDDSLEEVEGYIGYATSLFKEETINRFVGYYKLLIEQLVEQPKRPYSELSLVGAEEYQKIINDWNKTDKEYPKDKTIHELVEEQVTKTPDNIALVFEGQQLTYKELNAKANQLARHIRNQYKQKTGKEFAPDTLIALFMDRSLEMVISILGILKAGGAYVPIDMDYPQDRVDYMLQDMKAELVLTQRGLAASKEITLPAEKVLHIDLGEDLYKKENSKNLVTTCKSTDLAYVLYTSGTTGNPKGVMLEHFSLCNRIIHMIAYSKISQSDVYIFKTNYIFDVSFSDLFTHLLVGAKIQITKSRFDIGELEALLTSDQFTSLHLVPSQYELVSSIINNSSIKKIYFSGEALTTSILSRIATGIEVYNYYGPTEVGEITGIQPTSPDQAVQIGSVFPNCRQYVLDSSSIPVPVGVAGELYIGGAGLARGYLNNETLTNTRFISNPFATEGDKEKGYTRLYKTGDIVRLLADGSLEFIGRNDNQVKIRGYRVELGEIEHTMQQISGIKQSCVLVCERETTSGKIKYLVGYYVPDQRSEVVTQSGILTHLSRVLPDYMVPSALVAMESFPLTINGKLDKRALPVPELDDKDSYVAPTTETEKTLSKIWAEVLGLERVGIEDNFFRIGGDSLRAIQTSHRMSKALGMTVSISDIFKYKTISELLGHKGSYSKVTIPRIKVTKAPLSFSQERLWFIEEYEEGTNAYHIPLIFELEQGTDKEGIKYAIRQIVSRHEILRSTISRGEDQKGVQEVHDEPLKIAEVSVEEIDFEESIGEDINRPFVLSEEYPIKVKLYTVIYGDSMSKEILLINLHHIASDGWSIEIFQNEMHAYYEGYVSGNTNCRLPELEIQYKDYAAWQRSYLTGDLLSQQINYWKQKLSGYENLALPTDYSRPGEVDYKGSSQVFILSKATSEKLRTLAKEKATTLHSVLLSSVSILLGKYSGTEDIITGSPIANRHHWQTEKLIGFFVNSQVNRVVLRQGQSFESLIETTHQDQVLSQSHQDLPFEKLIDELDVERDPSRHPIFQVMFGVHGFGKSESEVPGKKGNYLSVYEGASGYEVSKFDVSIFFDDSQEELIGYIEYATSLFKEETINRLVGYYQSLIERLVQEPQRPYSELSLVEAEEYQKLIYDWNKTDKVYPKDRTIQALFEEQAATRTPDSIALVYEGEQLTYKELNEKSNQLARHIRSQYKERTGQELTSDTLIPICLNRSFEMIVGILGVLKAGGAYVPVDPEIPKARIDYLLADTQAELVLTQRHLAENSEIQLPRNKVLYADLTEELYLEEDAANLPSYSTFKDLAYVIYTSGTTGKPKGVMVEHSAVINYVNNVKEVLLDDVINIDLSTNIGFDLTITTAICPLLLFRKIFIYSGKLSNTDQYVEHLIKNRIDFIKSTPSLLANLSLEYFNNYRVKQAFVGGEKLEAFQLAHISKYVDKIIDEYGPTEATVGTSYISKNIVSGCEGIGRPYFNYKIYILDQNNNPVPVGVTGELYIGGAGVARGYLNNKTLTKERFISNPFATEIDRRKGYTRLYKTGDLVRWLADGNLEYLGRNDSQVKIRGYRIELGEIEHALQQIPGVRQSCVLAREREAASGKSKYLVGYYVAEHGVAEKITALTILNHLQSVLPEYMVPGALVALESLPLTINGKLDKRALPDPDFVDKESYVAPVTETEKVLSKIWSEVLGVERVGVADNFFRIGGDSILAIRLTHQMSKLLGYEVKVADVFKLKSINNLLNNIESPKITEESVEWEL